MPEQQLFHAIRDGDLTLVEQILACNPALAAARNDDGTSAVTVAAYHGQPGIVDALRRRELELDIFEAAMLGDHEQVSALVQERPSRLHMRSADGFTAVGLAAFFGHPHTLDLLLEMGADPNAPSSNKMKVAPIHSALAHRDAETAAAMVDALLERNTDVNARQMAGWTPLHQAASRGDFGLVQRLINAGADPAIKNDHGQTPSDLARDKGLGKIATLLAHHEIVIDGVDELEDEDGATVDD